MASSTENVSATITIQNRNGLHARPAMAMVDLLNRYKASVVIEKGEERFDGKSIMQVMMLAATCGTELRIEAKGPDAKEMIGALSSLAENRFNEEDDGVG